MRKQLVKTVEKILDKDKKVVLLLGDIGVFGFRESFKNHPDRVYNIGILEQSTIGVAAGMSMIGLTPIVHTIAPFLVERCFEQIKNDFGYQKLGGNLVSVGASYDYAALGCTHHCPADVPILKNIPDVEIVVPGTPEEFDTLFTESYNNGHITYFRLSEKSNEAKIPLVKFGKANVIKIGKLGTVFAVGPMLDNVINATKDLDVTVIYLTTIRPFDFDTIKRNISGDKIIICEPYYSGATTEDILNCVSKPTKIEHICVPKNFLNKYGSREEQNKMIGFTEQEIKTRIKKIIDQ